MAQQGGGDFETDYLPLTGDELILANQAGSTLDLKLTDLWRGVFVRHSFSIGGTTSNYVLLPTSASLYSQYMVSVTALEDGRWRKLDLGVTWNTQASCPGGGSCVRFNYEAVVPLPATTYLHIYEMTGIPGFA